MDEDDSRLDDVEGASCESIRAFLVALANDASLLRAYVNDPARLLTERGKEFGLSQGDVLLLLESDYRRVHELMSTCQNSAVRWICIWIV